MHFSIHGKMKKFDRYTFAPSDVHEAIFHNILSTITFELFLLLGFDGRINFLISFCAFTKSEIRLKFGNLNILISFSSHIVFADYTTRPVSSLDINVRWKIILNFLNCRKSAKLNCWQGAAMNGISLVASCHSFCPPPQPPDVSTLEIWIELGLAASIF